MLTSAISSRKNPVVPKAPIPDNSASNADAVRQPLAKRPEFSRDGKAYPSPSAAAMQRALAPLSQNERQRAVHLTHQLVRSQPGSPHFRPSVPSHAVGPYSGAQYTFTCCPSERATPGIGSFNLDNFLDEAFRTGTTTTLSLTSEGDARHSTYYKRSQTTPSGKYTVASHGTPAYTTAVDDAGKQVTGSIFHNTVRNNHTGQVHQMKMMHVNGWRDMTAMESKAELKVLSDLGNNVKPADFKKMLIHCSAGIHRTASASTHLEMMNAVATGRKPNAVGLANWFRGARVANALTTPTQAYAVAASCIRLGR